MPDAQPAPDSLPLECEACQPWLRAIQDSYAYLFQEHGFRLAHCAAAQQGEHCLIVLASDQAQVKFEIDHGRPVMYVGTLASPVGWGQQVDGVPVWYVDNALLNFMEHPTRPTDPAPAPLAGLVAAAARLRPHAAAVLAAFASDGPAAWWQAFNAYQAERLAQLRQRAL